MKIAHVIVGGEMGGGQKICGEVINALYARGDSAIVISPSRGSFTRQLESRNIPVHYVACRKSYHIGSAFELARCLKREKVDMVHTHGMLTSNVLARLAARWAKIPAISHIHSDNFFNPHPWVRRYQILFDNATSKYCSAHIAVSQSIRDALVRQGVAENKIHVIHNGIDPDSLHISRKAEEVRSEFNLSLDQPLIGMAGMLCPLKGQEEFLRVAARITKLFPKVCFMIVGKDIEKEGAYEVYLKRLVEKLDLADKVIFTGYRSDVLDLIHALDLFVHPSKKEGLPVVILEAMALGKAVIASRVDGIPEIVLQDVTGILTEPGDMEEIYQAMVTLLSRPQLAVKFGNRGRDRVIQYFNQKKMIKEIFDVYDHAPTGSRRISNQTLIDSHHDDRTN